MLTKRIIPCLDIKNGRTVKGINFVSLVDAGDPVEQAAIYSAAGADELVFLDITATLENRKTLVELVREVASKINIPFTVGGGITSISHVSDLLNAGADKVSVNSAAVREPDLVDRLAATFGSQCIVVAIDSKQVDGQDLVHTHGGSRSTNLETLGWAREVENRGAGEILLTSMDHDGTKSGFANTLTSRLSQALTIPVIASGGGGTTDHFVEVFTHGKADAALAASIFHFNEIEIKELKDQLQAANIPMRI
ncbi:MAG: imidazole glycerol phosphate synthase subunit HisF [Cyclobacteriaceae bacterium]|nr:MAG: imidazole glycerol phosphate synthase subunit HisF [Cyclobacteriaceae bacterium]